MLINGWKTLMVRCSICGKIVEDDFNLFASASMDREEFLCECGSIVAVFESMSGRNAILSINCHVCGEIHKYHFNIINLIMRDRTYKCDYGSEICLIGDMKNGNHFTDSNIMILSLKEIDALQIDNKINCKCGFSDIFCELYFDRIELKCKNCNGVIIIYAEELEDLQVLKEKKTILLEKNDISCLGSRIDKIRDLTNL